MADALRVDSRSRVGRAIVAFALYVAALLGAAAGPASAQLRVRPHALHDLRLGTTLEDFKKLEFLEEDDRKDVRIICTGTPQARLIEKLRLSKAVESTKAIRCGLFKDLTVEVIPPAAPMKVFGEQVEPLFTFYAADKDPIFRLVQISAVTSNARVLEIANILRRTYGPPTNFEISAVSTSFERELSNVTYFWDNTISTIRVDSVAVAIDLMSILFLLNAPFEEMTAKVRVFEKSEVPPPRSIELPIAPPEPPK